MVTPWKLGSLILAETQSIFDRLEPRSPSPPLPDAVSRSFTGLLFDLVSTMPLLPPRAG
jgi:hypothetical protein